MGLDQLLCMVTEPAYKTKALEMYERSTKEEHWYFFAVTGINITQKLINTLKDSKDQAYKIDIEGPILSHY